MEIRWRLGANRITRLPYPLLQPSRTNALISLSQAICSSSYLSVTVYHGLDSLSEFCRAIKLAQSAICIEHICGIFTFPTGYHQFLQEDPISRMTMCNPDSCVCPGIRVCQEHINLLQVT